MCYSRSCAMPPMPWPARWPRHPAGDCPAHDPGSTTPTSPPTPPPPCTTIGDAVIGLSGWPPSHLGWAQYRALGAVALDLCAVACGVLDGYVDCSHDAHGPWDYLGGALVCREAGAVVTDAHGRD